MLKLKENLLQSERIFWIIFGSFYDFFVFYKVDFFTECSFVLRFCYFITTKKTNDKKQLSFAADIQLSLCVEENILIC